MGFWSSAWVCRARPLLCSLDPHGGALAGGGIMMGGGAWVVRLLTEPASLMLCGLGDAAFTEEYGAAARSNHVHEDRPPVECRCEGAQTT